ncbi:MAG: hypothetical protein ABI601_01085 [bacterium]
MSSPLDLRRWLGRTRRIATLLALGALPLGAQRAVTASQLANGARPADAGGTVTAALRLANLLDDTVLVTPHVAAPADWTVLLGGLPFRLAPREEDSWLVTVLIPTRAAAGRYVIPLSAEAGGARVAEDSLVVQVGERRAIDLVLTDEPTYALSGAEWRASFRMRNTGNVATTIAFRATSALGRAPIIEPAAMTLAANESRVVRVRSSTALADRESHDDVLELFATDQADTSVNAVASTRVTIVQRAGRAESRHTVASTLRLRAVEPGVGVSPFEMTGAGKLREGGDEQVDFTLRGPAGPVSLFGDRDQYSLAIRAPTYEARVGDALYGSALLLTTGQIGAGAGVDVMHGSFGFGGYVNRARYQRDGATEQSAFVSTKRDGITDSPLLTVTALNRTGSYLAGRLLDASSTLHPVGDMRVSLELAGSQSANGTGLGHAVHASGGKRIAYDVSHIMGDATFAGVTRGNRHDYASVSTELSDDLQLSASASSHRSQGESRFPMLASGLRTAALELSYSSRFSLRYSSMTRSALQPDGRGDASQHSIGGRVGQAFGTTQVWGSGDFGVSNDDLTSAHRAYRSLAWGASTVAAGQSFSLFGESHEGAAVTLGANRFASYGGDVTLHLGHATTLSADAIQTRIPSLRAAEYGQIDARLARVLPNGSTATLRARGMSGLGAAMFGSRIVFLEYAMPLRLPTDEIRSTGRVRGQVVNEETGRGVAGALVRLGPQAAITDERGRVAFAGVPAGEYRLSLSRQTPTRDIARAGDVTVRVDSGVTQASTFTVAVKRAGTIAGSVREMTVARTGIGAEADSLADGGALEGTMVALIGARDTLYRPTDAAGRFEFTDVVGGSWTLQIADPAPPLARWTPRSIPVTLAPGERAQVEFRRVPRKVDVRIINGDRQEGPIENVPNEDRRRQK